MTENKNKRRQVAPANTGGLMPPQAVDIETSILGALLLEKHAIYDVVDLVKPEMFYHESNQMIYRAIVSLYRAKNPIDILTVTAQLRKEGTLEMCGGAYTITELTSRVSGSSNMEYWCRIVMEKYLARELIRSSSEIIRSAYDDTSDPFDLLGQMSSFVSGAEMGFIGSSEHTVADIATKTMMAREIAPVDKHGIDGLESGVYELDRLINGFNDGELIVIAARPSIGKTAVICSIARHINYETRKALALFSLEMSADQIFLRLETNFSGIASNKIRSNSLTIDERVLLSQTDMKLADGTLIIEDTSYMTVDQLISKIKMFIRKYGIKAVILDYLQLLASLGIKGGNRESEISYMTRAIKVCAQDMKIPIIILSQLSRQVESRRPFCFPALSDLRESGAIEQDADKVIFLWRPDYYLTEEMQNDPKLKIGTQTFFRLFNKWIDNKNLLVFIVAKHREGELGNVPALFTPWNMRISNHPALSAMPEPKNKAEQKIPLQTQIDLSAKDEGDVPF